MHFQSCKLLIQRSKGKAEARHLRPAIARHFNTCAQQSPARQHSHAMFRILHHHSELSMLSLPPTLQLLQVWESNTCRQLPQSFEILTERDCRPGAVFEA